MIGEDRGVSQLATVVRSQVAGGMRRSACEVCGGLRWARLARTLYGELLQCSQCGVLLDGSRARTAPDPGQPIAAFEAACMRALKRCLAPGEAVLVVEESNGTLARAASRAGYPSVGVRPEDIHSVVAPGAGFGAAVVATPRHWAGDPSRVLAGLRAALAPHAFLIAMVPWKGDGSSWAGSRSVAGEGPSYVFDRGTLQGALLRNGFGQIRLFDVPARGHEQNRDGAVLAVARPIARRERQLLSIIMPVYNERDTFLEMFEQVYEKEVPPLDKEIIIVESNSSDGTRELVEAVASRPGVRVVYQPRAQGKGNAVREGFACAQGDVILIQDADTEYSVDDYDVLIGPVARYETPVVLGSRHIGSWKIRHFNEQPVLTGLFNLGHVFFVGLFNLVYGQQLRDPYTMYKVFQRECLFDLTFECNRFDFDHELVIKLVRKGYLPTEIPVYYNARSFDEGKKVSVFRDPLTWLRAIVKYRLTPMAPRRAPLLSRGEES